MSDRIDHEGWPARAAMLSGLGAILGIATHFALYVGEYRWTEDPFRLGLAALFLVGGIAFAFTLERIRWQWSALFAAGCGLVVALIVYSNGSPSGQSTGDEWHVIAALLAVAIAAPLFQTVRDEGRRRLGYDQVHAHAWTNIVLWCACWAFVLITYLLAQLLSELFHLIGIDLLRDALRKGWFTATLLGAAFGAAAGLLRDRDKVLGLLQRVVTTVLSVLAPVLAVGLALFVLALPITGLAPLWEKTSSTTPILLVAIAGAFLLANAVIGNCAEEEAKGAALRWSAMTLAAVMAPLALVATISTWLRIDQHGFTPERLWALVFVLIVVTIALTYLWTLVRGGRDWASRVRPTNIRLAVGLCGIALLLALPIVNFGAISTRNQLARLEAGQVKPEEFDWAALKFDFGSAGRRALERLATSGPPALRQYAQNARALTTRWAAQEETRVGQEARQLARNIRVLPRQLQLPPQMMTVLARQSVCGHGRCTLFWAQGERSAVAVGFPCEHCQATASQLMINARGEWQVLVTPGDIERGTPASIDEQRAAIQRGEIEIRPIQRRQVFVGGKAVGPVFE